jgi:hypothetical protein
MSVIRRARLCLFWWVTSIYGINPASSSLPKIMDRVSRKRSHEDDDSTWHSMKRIRLTDTLETYRGYIAAMKILGFMRCCRAKTLVLRMKEYNERRRRRMASKLRRMMPPELFDHDVCGLVIRTKVIYPDLMFRVEIEEYETTTGKMFIRNILKLGNSGILTRRSLLYLTLGQREALRECDRRRTDAFTYMTMIPKIDLPEEIQERMYDYFLRKKK